MIRDRHLMEQFNRCMMHKNNGGEELPSDYLGLLKDCQPFSREKVDREYLQNAKRIRPTRLPDWNKHALSAPNLPSQARPSQPRPPKQPSCFMEISHSIHSACHCKIKLYIVQLFIKMLSYLTLVRYMVCKYFSLSIGCFFILLFLLL